MHDPRDDQDQQHPRRASCFCASRTHLRVKATRWCGGSACRKSTTDVAFRVNSQNNLTIAAMCKQSGKLIACFPFAKSSRKAMRLREEDSSSEDDVSGGAWASFGQIRDTRSGV